MFYIVLPQAAFHERSAFGTEETTKGVVLQVRNNVYSLDGLQHFNLLRTLLQSSRLFVMVSQLPFSAPVE